MNKTIVPHKCLLTVFAATAAIGPTGCGSPPSVVPVLRVVGESLEREAQNIESIDAASDQIYFDSIRRDLAEAFRSDLQDTETLTPDWVESATVVYVAAREQLLQNEIARTAQRETRVENLNQAAQAQARAIAILEQQDQVLQRLGIDLWRVRQSNREAQP